MIKLICFYLIFVGNRKIENETLFLRIITFNYGLILFLFKRTAMEKLLNENFIREITPLSDKDCFYIADRHKKEFTYPMHCHREFELNFVEHAPGVRRVVGDSAEVIGDYDLVLITSPDLEHVWAGEPRPYHYGYLLSFRKSKAGVPVCLYKGAVHGWT